MCDLYPGRGGVPGWWLDSGWLETLLSRARGVIDTEPELSSYELVSFARIGLVFRYVADNHGHMCSKIIAIVS